MFGVILKSQRQGCLRCRGCVAFRSSRVRCHGLQRLVHVVERGVILYQCRYHKNGEAESGALATIATRLRPPIDHLDLAHAQCLIH